jgi:hypothetical protein
MLFAQNNHKSTECCLHKVIIKAQIRFLARKKIAKAQKCYLHKIFAKAQKYYLHKIITQSQKCYLHKLTTKAQNVICTK